MLTDTGRLLGVRRLQCDLTAAFRSQVHTFDGEGIAVGPLEWFKIGRGVHRSGGQDQLYVGMREVGVAANKPNRRRGYATGEAIAAKQCTQDI